ncbi:alpha/beta hydrolase, partial [Xanthomonas oryzae pv. oryzae]
MPGFFHDTLGERDRAIAITQIRQFVQARFAQPPVRAALRDAHRAGPSFEEAERLAWP